MPLGTFTLSGKAEPDLKSALSTGLRRIGQAKAIPNARGKATNLKGAPKACHPFSEPYRETFQLRSTSKVWRAVSD
eukprot:8788194-Pyramimonas_sp.AAC.1